MIVGIDPGLDGALAFLGHESRVIDMPTRTLEINGNSRRREVDLGGLWRILSSVRECHAFVEKVHGMPKMGGSAMFTFGSGYGALLMGLTAAAIPYTPVTPQAWKKRLLAGMGPGKGASIARACQLFPELAGEIGKKDGRAEAILIAHYGVLETQPALFRCAHAGCLGQHARPTELCC